MSYVHRYQIEKLIFGLHIDKFRHILCFGCTGISSLFLCDFASFLTLTCGKLGLPNELRPHVVTFD